MIFGKNGFVSEENESTVEESSLILEAAIMDTFSNEEIEEALENTHDIDIAVNQGIVMEKTIVRLDKKAKQNKAEKMAIFTLAKERKDPDFKKLLNVWRIERFLEAKLEKKFGAKAKTKAREVMRNASKSKSKMIKTATAKAKKMVNVK